MISALDSEASGPASSPGRLGQDTLLSLCLSPPSCINEYPAANLMLGVTLRWTSTPSKGSRNTPSHFMLQKLR